MSVLSGKSALVTGASEGIGKAIAIDLALKGAFVIVNSRSQSKCDAVVEEIKQKGGDAFAIAADVSKVAEIKTLFDKIAQIRPQLDIVVNNAGVAEFTPIANVTEEEFDRIFSVNAKGAFFVLQAASKAVVDGGRIIAISSTGTKLAVPTASVYLGTKGALDQFVKILAVELAHRKVSVNTVSPGYTVTSMLPDAMKEPASNAALFKRLGVVEDITPIVTFLASPESAWITGQNIHINGGVNVC